MVSAFSSKCLCLVREGYEFFNICLTNIEEEKESDIESDHVVMNNATGNKRILH